MIYTSYFANLKNVSKECVPVSVCLYPPDFWGGLQYKSLAPREDDFRRYKKSGNQERFVEDYIINVLNRKKQEDVVSELYRLSNGRDVVLMCYEKPKSFCHRQVISHWLNSAGFACEEL